MDKMILQSYQRKEKQKAASSPIYVDFLSGESRYGNDNHGVNYMLANCYKDDGEEIELYSEIKIDDYEPFIRFIESHPDIDWEDMNREAEEQLEKIKESFDGYTYPLLLQEITNQAQNAGIDKSRLDF